MQDITTDIRHERIFRFVFLCLFFAYPVSSFVTEFLQIDSNLISIASRGLQVVTCGWYSFFLIRHHRFRISLPQFPIFLLFWSLYTVRIIFDTTFHGGQLGFPPSQYYLFGFILSFLCSIPLFAAAPLNETKLEWQVLILSILLTILALYNTLKSEELFLVRMGGNERLNPITTGIIATLPVLICIKRIFFSPNKTIFLILFYSACIVIGIITLLIVSTKVMFICVALVLVLMIIYLLQHGKIGTLAGIFSFLGLAILFVLYGGYTDYFTLSLVRFTDIGQDQSSQERIDLLNGAIRQFFESPIAGSFLEEKVMKFYPHNLIVESLMATGIIGGAIFFIFYIIFCIQTVVVTFKTEFGAISILGAAFCLMALTSGSLSFSAEFWYIAAVISWWAKANYKIEIPGQPSNFLMEVK